MSEKSCIPLHLNESYWLLTEEMMGKYARLTAVHAATYPEYTPLIQAIAKFAEVPAEEITLTAGSDAAIDAILALCAKKGLRPLIPLPTFSAYELICKKYDIEYTPVYYKQDGDTFTFPLAETIAHLQSGSVGMLFLCQPNNPLGSRIPHDDYTQMLEVAHASSVTVVVDEAYSEFCPEHDAAYVKNHEMVLLRTFSKSFGLAGIRVGYSIANARITKNLLAQLLPWPIAHPSMRIALAALSDSALFEERRKLLMQERDTFAAELSKRSGVHVFQSSTNFLLARVPDAGHMQSSLLGEGILISTGASKSLDVTAQALLASTVRMSVPSPSDRPRVLAAIDRALATGQ